MQTDAYTHTHTHTHTHCRCSANDDVSRRGVGGSVTSHEDSDLGLAGEDAEHGSGECVCV
jgi:hypothetical protein